MEGNGVGFILGSLHFSLFLSDGQKTNRSFEKKKETGGRRRESTSRGENKHSPGRSLAKFHLSPQFVVLPT